MTPGQASPSTDQAAVQAISTGRVFLKRQFRQDHDHLKCAMVGYPGQCQVDNMGRVVIQSYTWQVIGDLLTAQDQQKVVAQIRHEKHPVLWIWGHMKNVTPDSDDTSFALQLLTMLDQPIKLDGLSIFYNQKYNAYTTFPSVLKPHVVSYPNVPNNQGIHLEVNANVFYLLQQLGLSDRINYRYLEESQAMDGSWSGYFYQGKYYATYLVMRLLCAGTGHSEAIKKGVAFIRQGQKPDGSWGNPYSTALALNTLTVCRSVDPDVGRKAVNYLTRTQRSDGSWQHADPIWAAVMVDSPPSIMYGYDDERMLTTALVTRALMNISQAI